MNEVINLDIRSFINTAVFYRKLPGVRAFVDRGDKTVYSKLNPFSEAAFNYRDSIEVENHISGIELTRRTIPVTGEILYLASSYGLGPYILKQLGYPVIAADIDLKALKYTRADLAEVAADAKKLPFRNNSFSAIVSRDFLVEDYLSSTSDRVQVIDEMFRVLKRGGPEIFYTLYCPEQLDNDDKDVSDGLPELSLLTQFRLLRNVSIKYKDRPDKNSLAYVAIK